MPRPSYRRALRWLLDNDDCDWLKDETPEHGLSVAAALVADLFGKTDKEVFYDLKKLMKKERD